MRRYKWKKIVMGTVWMLIGAGTIVLLGAAMQKKNQKKCSDIKIEITGVERHMFIDEKDVLTILNAAGPVVGNKIATINLRAMETMVEKNSWVKNAEMFIDNNQVLQVRIEERQPVARVFTLEGSSFYLDSNALRLPLSEKISARVPVFTGFPSDKPKLAKPDSALLYNIVKIGQYIGADSFWMAQVAQVDITPQSNFEMIPIVGDHVVVLGDAENVDNKFKRLYTFYRKAWLQNGINTYEKFDVQYNNQVVAVKKGTTKARIDSARSKEIMNNLLASSPLRMNDSSGVNISSKPPVQKLRNDTATLIKPVLSVRKSIVKPSVKSNSITQTNNKTGVKPLSKEKKSKPVVKNTHIKKQAAKLEQPKAVLKKVP